MYCYLHLKDGTTPKFADEFSVTERVSEVENQVFDAKAFVFPPSISPPPRKVTPRNASLH